MKRIFLFALSLIMCGATMMGQDILNRVHPNDASYKIEGDFNYRIVNNDVRYELTNVIPTGLQIRQQDVYLGIQPEGKEVKFTFDQIVTPEEFPGFDNISYWYYDPEISDWQPDVEIRKGERTSELRKDITMVLIIDCSSSLRNDFNIVKNATTRFLDQMYNAAPNGNIHIGIIGFSSMPDTKILPIQPLNRNSYSNMRAFISSLTVNNGTALFYAWDKAMEQTEQYIHSGNMRHYEKSHFITFTDGIDQTSQDIHHRPTPIVTADDYYNYIIQTAKNKIYNYESDVVFVKGMDITNTQQQAKFESKLSQLAYPVGDQHYERLESINRLEYKFNEIASRLTDSWKMLNCYVAPARHGRVCWTFGRAEYKPAPQPKPQPKTGRNIFLGLNGTVGLPMSVMYGYNNNSFGVGLNLKVGLDFAYPVSDRFGIGFYATAGGGPLVAFGEGLGGGGEFKLGLLMTAGDVNDKPFLIGVAPFTGFGVAFAGGCEVIYVPVEFRFGRVVKEHFYMTGNLTIGVPVEGYFFMEPSLTFGYHFGDKLKTRR